MTENRHPTSNSTHPISHAILMPAPCIFKKKWGLFSWHYTIYKIILIVFFSTLSPVPVLGFDILNVAVSAVGAAFSGPAASGFSYVVDTVTGKGHELLTTPKDPKNTINIKINNLSTEDVKKICVSNICKLNNENILIRENNSANLRDLRAILQKNDAEIDFWLGRYLISIHCIQKVNSFLSVRLDVHNFLISQQQKLNSGSAIPRKQREKLNEQYEMFINHIQNRRVKIGAMVKNQFPYNGEGGLHDKYTSTTTQQKIRYHLYGVYKFGPKDHERTHSPLDAIIPNPKGKVEEKLNYFATAYKETVNQLHRNLDDILAEYNRDREVLYEILGLTAEGIEKLPEYTKTSSSSNGRPSTRSIGIPAQSHNAWGKPSKSRSSSSAPVKSKYFSDDESSDDESSEDEAPVSAKSTLKKTTPKAVAQKSRIRSTLGSQQKSSDDESEDESSEDEAPVSAKSTAKAKAKPVAKKRALTSKSTASLAISQKSSDDESDDESSEDETPLPAKPTAKAKVKPVAKKRTVPSKLTASLAISQKSSDDESDDESSEAEDDEEDTQQKTPASDESNDESDDDDEASDASDGLLT